MALTPSVGQCVHMSNTSPPVIEPSVAVALEFLEALQAEDLDRALLMLDEDVVYTNVSLPTIRGRAGVERVFRPTLGRMGFRVHFHAAGTDSIDRGVVLTERTDALIFGPVSVQFWVYGRFEVRDGQITLWRDSFDWRDMTMGLIRGLVGVVFPFVRRTWPRQEQGD
jgi:limonene-1,2-epoxide hydrolase